MMSNKRPFTFFQVFSLGVLCLFMGILVVVVGTAYARPKLQTFRIEVYHSPSETWNLERAKAPGFNDRKWVHISNIDPFAIVESRELSRSSKSKFQTGCGITEKGE